MKQSLELGFVLKNADILYSCPIKSLKFRRSCKTWFGIYLKSGVFHKIKGEKGDRDAEK